jgi:hypothetical protein
MPSWMRSTVSLPIFWKSFDSDVYEKVTHVSLQPTLILVRYLDTIHKPT